MKLGYGGIIMKKLILFFLLLCSMLIAEEGFTGNIDNFENGNITEAPNWWTFGDIEPVVVDTGIYSKDPLFTYLGKYALKITGKTKEYYIGGMGCYLGGEADSYTHLKIYIYSDGVTTGKINIQLYDDDNNNYTLEQDVNNNYEPISDDRFEYQIAVNWKGWKVLLIPLTAFKDTNPKVGDNIWNPSASNGSGGLLHYQMIFLASKKVGETNIVVDNIKIVNLKGGESK